MASAASANPNPDPDDLRECSEGVDDDAVEADTGGVYDEADVERSCREPRADGGKRPGEDERTSESFDMVAERFRCPRGGRMEGELGWISSLSGRIVCNDAIATSDEDE